MRRGGVSGDGDRPVAAHGLARGLRCDVPSLAPAVDSPPLSRRARGHMGGGRAGEGERPPDALRSGAAGAGREDMGAVPAPGAPQVQALPAALSAEAACVMADALANSPGYVYFLRGDEPFRRRALTWFLERNIAAVRRRSPNALRGVLSADGRVIAAFMLTSSAAQPTDWDLLVSGLLLLPLFYGVPVLRRMLETMAWFKDAGAAYFSGPARGADAGGRPPAPAAALVLERMTVRPDCQGKGIGTACVLAAVAEARAAGAAVRLATQERRNVALYERLGFVTVGERDFVASEPAFAYHSWFMEHAG